MSGVVELAARVEALCGPCRETDRAIWAALGNCVHSMAVIERNDDLVTACVKCGDVRGFAPPAFTASLDAALTLVPEQRRVGLMQQPSGVEWECALLTLEGDDSDIPLVRAATHALALTAAALRARAGDDQ